MKLSPTLILGRQHTDSRGTIAFVNDFDMSQVRRMYMISHHDTKNKRGWRGHQIEQRWFIVTEGAFEIRLAKIDDWLTPNPDLELEEVILSSLEIQVLHVPAGYATCIQARIPDSRMVVYGDKAIEEASKDDHLYPADYFNGWK